MPTPVSRREFVGFVAAGLAAKTALAQRSGAGKTYAYVGSWTQGRFGSGGGGGISVFDVGADASLTFKTKLGQEFDDMNAGYLAISADGRFLYSTEEVSDLHDEVGAGGGVFSFAINAENGSLSYLNSQPSMGVNPAYIAIDHTGRFLLAPNHGNYAVTTRVVTGDGTPRIEKVYDDATVAVLPLNADGTIAAATDVAILDRVGGAPGIEAQRSPHAHSVSFDPSGQWLVVADKGANRIYSYRLNRQNGTLESARFVRTEAGVSPRHSVFHPRGPWLFVSYEHVPEVAAFHFDSDNGQLRHLHTLPTVPPGTGEVVRPSDIKIHPNGNFIYTANRGHDSIAIHRVNESTGMMEEVAIVSSGGAGPRGMTFDPSGNYLYVANQGSNEISTFLVDAETGLMTNTGHAVEVLKPACIKFLQV